MGALKDPHGGVLKNLYLDEAGVKLDLVAGRGIGAVGALFAAIDGGQRLWDDRGFWRGPEVSSFYRWCPSARAIVWTLAVSAALVAVPLTVVAAGLIVFPLDFLLRIAGAGGAGGLVGAYLSYFLDGATGGIIVVLQTLVCLLAFAFAPKHGWLAARRRVARESAL